MWLFQGKQFNEEDIDKYVGFIYLITDKTTGRKYVGQKVFFNKVAKKPLKGKKNRRIAKKQSDWKTYYGSNEELKALALENPENFEREILRLCSAKSEMNYWEAWEIFNRHALLSKDEYFNSWISTRINKNQLRLTS